MTLVDQVEKMIEEHQGKLSPSRETMSQFERLVAAGLVQRRVYDIPPVDVFGRRAAGGIGGSTPVVACDAKNGGVRSIR